MAFLPGRVPSENPPDLTIRNSEHFQYFINKCGGKRTCYLAASPTIPPCWAYPHTHRRGGDLPRFSGRTLSQLPESWLCSVTLELLRA